MSRSVELVCTGPDYLQTCKQSRYVTKPASSTKSFILSEETLYHTNKSTIKINNPILKHAKAIVCDTESKLIYNRNILE